MIVVLPIIIIIAVGVIWYAIANHYGECLGEFLRCNLKKFKAGDEDYADKRDEKNNNEQK